MKVGVLGTGDVGKALGKAFITLGHEVRIGSRTKGNEKALAFVKEMGGKASEGTFADAAAFGDVVVIATLGTATEDAVRQAKPESFKGKLVIDTTNPLDFSGGMPPKMFVGATDSLGERIQRIIKDAHVVKAFNSVGNAFMFKPDFPGGPPDMFICGNDDGAKKQMTQILTDFGWGTLDVGGIEASRYLEPMCLVWVLTAMKTGNWNQAFKMLRK